MTIHPPTIYDSTMITSNFTLEYDVDVSSRDNKTWLPNIPRTPMPEQLNRLNVPEPVWVRLYDNAAGVVERALAREINKKELDKWLSNKRNTTGYPKAREKVTVEKEKHDSNTLKGWTSLISECSSELRAYGVSATLMIDAKSKCYFGVDFRCASIHCNKLKLTWIERIEKWTWPRTEVPNELAALHVDEKTWQTVWYKCTRTFIDQQSLEGKKEAILDKLSVTSVHGRKYVSSDELKVGRKEFKTYMQELNRLDNEIERKWGKLLEAIDDSFFMFGITTTTATSNSSEIDGRYAGIILRFKPMVSTVPVIHDATVALSTPIPSAPAR